MGQKLWTRDFTILTIGTAVSLLGNTVSGFAVGLLVLDYTGSTFLYALFLAGYYLPKIFAPLLAGPYLDRISRKKVIYRLDFLSSFLYLALFLLLFRGWFHYTAFLLGVLIIGTVDGVYTVAYDSLYPNLVSPGNFSKAYSVSSILYPLAAFMVPVASVVYNALGSAAPLFLFNAVTFFTAACFERSIGYQETHMDAAAGGFSAKRYARDFREGLDYLKREPGLMAVTAYFFVTMAMGSSLDTLALPFFKNHPALFSSVPINVVTLYTVVSTCGVLGRLIGGWVHYRFAYPPEKKFAIAVTVYIVTTILQAGQLYLPILPMMLCAFTVGILSVTSYSIRLSSTQAYVPDDKRARFNGVFQMFSCGGQILGILSCGALTELFPERSIVVGMMGVNMVAIFLTVYRRREDVKTVYNRNV